MLEEGLPLPSQSVELGDDPTLALAAIKELLFLLGTYQKLWTGLKDSHIRIITSSSTLITEIIVYLDADLWWLYSTHCYLNGISGFYRRCSFPCTHSDLRLHRWLHAGHRRWHFQHLYTVWKSQHTFRLHTITTVTCIHNHISNDLLINILGWNYACKYLTDCEIKLICQNTLFYEGKSRAINKTAVTDTYCI